MAKSSFWTNLGNAANVEIFSQRDRDELVARKGFRKMASNKLYASSLANASQAHAQKLIEEGTSRFDAYTSFNSDEFYQSYNWDKNRQNVDEQMHGLTIKQMLKAVQEATEINNDEDAFEFLIALGRQEQTKAAEATQRKVEAQAEV